MVPEFGNYEVQQDAHAEAERLVREVAELAPKDEWKALARLNRLAYNCGWGYKAALGAGVVTAIRAATKTFGNYRHSGRLELDGFAWFAAALIALGIMLYVVRKLALRASEARLSRLQLRGYDIEKLRFAARTEAELEPVRAWRREDERWSAQRVAAPPWWRTELSGGQLLMNLYILGGAAVLIIQPDEQHIQWYGLVVLGGFAVFFKLFVPGVFALFMLITADRQQGLRDTWRYYQWWARSKFAIAFLICLGLLVLFGTIAGSSS